jgi:hypothetical protein
MCLTPRQAGCWLTFGCNITLTLIGNSFELKLSSLSLVCEETAFFDKIQSKE